MNATLDSEVNVDGSRGGSRVYVHGQVTPWSVPSGEECLEQITLHIENYLGPIETVFHELISDTVHIDIHMVEPTREFPYIRLITSGMSDLPMHLPEGVEAPRYAELMLTLPPDWKVNEEAFGEDGWYWPIHLLKFLARLPHKYNTWLGWGHTIPNGDPAEPYATNVDFTGAILAKPILAPEGFHTLNVGGNKEIAFFSVIPLHPEEMEMKLKSGAGSLLQRFAARGMTDLIDIRRADVTKKRFGFFGS